jgi:RpiR family glv operon transcriptional regulator
MEFDTVVNDHYHVLNHADKEIVMFIAQNKEFVCDSSIAQVARQAHYSQSSIFRVCQKLGLTGFSQLRYMLQEELSAGGQAPTVDYVAQTIKSVLWTANQFKATNLTATYQAFQTAQHVFLYSTGWVQQVVAEQMQRNLFGMGVTVFRLPTGISEMELLRGQIEKNDLIVIFSHSGMNDVVVDLAQALKLHGAKIFAITALQQNKIAQLADYNLYYDALIKKVGVYERSEHFFVDLHVLIDLFCMGLGDYLMEDKLGREGPHDDHDDSMEK